MVSAANYWTDAKCAKAFWGQHELPPYKRLLADTIAWADPKPSENWLDLGCGGGAISKAIWEKSQGKVGSVLGVDCAATNEEKYRVLRESLEPSPGQRVRFQCHNFSAGLDPFADASIDHVVSGLSISYAESFDEATQTWNTEAYDRLLGEVRRILRPGGKFVFSVNVPEPSWLKVGLGSLGAVFSTARPFKFLKQSLRMMRYGRWLKDEARKGRFHYFSQNQVRAKLTQAGYRDVEHCLSYAGQAFIFRGWK
jgi:ubiquinone/menaquinone biosynthesis C-methylase UbiE